MSFAKRQLASRRKGSSLNATHQNLAPKPASPMLSTSTASHRPAALDFLKMGSLVQNIAMPSVRLKTCAGQLEALTIKTFPLAVRYVSYPKRLFIYAASSSERATTSLGRWEPRTLKLWNMVKSGAPAFSESSARLCVLLLYSM